MEVVLITGTMGAGKSKSLIDDYLLGSLAEEYSRGNVSLFKHYTETRNGNYIKSRAYDDKIFPCLMADDSTNFFVGEGKKCIIIEEFHAFRPSTIENIIGKMKSNGVNLLILSGLKYYASGELWPTYSALEDLCRKYGVNFREKTTFFSKCEHPGCNNYATRHKLNPASELKLQQGTFVFSQADLSDYQFFCEECFLKANGNLDNSLYLTQHTKKK
jgi:thymidine kinase